MMDFFRKSTTRPDKPHVTEKAENEKKNVDLPTINSCGSAFRVLEATVEDTVNAVASGGEELIKNVQDGGEQCVKVVEQGANIVKEGVDLADHGVNNITRLIKMCQNIYSIALKYRKGKYLVVAGSMSGSSPVASNLMNIFNDDVTTFYVKILKEIADNPERYPQWQLKKNNVYKGYIEADDLFQSTMAVVLWVFICYIFQPWMIPATILVILVRNHILRQLLGIPPAEVEQMLKEDKDKSIKEKLEAVEHILVCMKNIIGEVELLLGKIFEVFDVYLPSLFWIVVLLQIVLTAVLMYIPVNYLIMFYGISLYLKRFFNNYTTTLDKKSLNVIPRKTPMPTFNKILADSKSSEYIQVVDGKMASKCD